MRGYPVSLSLLLMIALIGRMKNGCFVRDHPRIVLNRDDETASFAMLLLSFRPLFTRIRPRLKISRRNNLFSKDRTRALALRTWKSCPYAFPR